MLHPNQNPPSHLLLLLRIGYELC